MACPSRSETTLGLTPSSNNIVEWGWRRPWTVIWGNPVDLTTLAKSLVVPSGSMGHPSAYVVQINGLRYMWADKGNITHDAGKDNDGVDGLVDSNGMEGH